MNSGTGRLRKNSMYDATPPAIVQSQKQSRRRRSLQAKRISRDKDFFVPDQIEEWVLPEYKSLFHHLFLKDEEGDSASMSSGVTRRCSTSSPSSSNVTENDRHRKISPTGSTASSSSTNHEEEGEDGPLCNLVKSFPSWLKKVFHITDDSERQAEENAEREAWLDEIPIEICDRLRHIHIYV